jgi:hypothetical protein
MSDIQQGEFFKLQEEIRLKLGADPEFSGIEVLTENQKDIVSSIDNALASIRGGVCCIVLTPGANVVYPNVKGPQFDEVAIVVRVIENVLVNRSATGTNKPATLVAENVAKSLHHHMTLGKKVITCKGIALFGDPDNLIYDVSFKTKIGL